MSDAPKAPGFHVPRPGPEHAVFRVGGSRSWTQPWWTDSRPVEPKENTDAASPGYYVHAGWRHSHRNSVC